MPNTPALVLAAASVLAPGKEVETEDTEIVMELLRCFGIVEPGSEKLLDAVTGLSGSGPAYVILLFETLLEWIRFTNIKSLPFSTVVSGYESHWEL